MGIRIEYIATQCMCANGEGVTNINNVPTDCHFNYCVVDGN